MNENTVSETGKNVELRACDVLRNARTTGRRKREIQTIAKQLCIREEFLQALEDGNYTFIPEVVYILGFARSYAIELGLDGDEIVAKIKQEMGLDTPGIVVADVDRDVAVRNSRTVLKKEKIKEIFNTQRLRDAWAFVRRNWRAILGAFVALVVVCGIAWAIVSAVRSGGDVEMTDAPAAAEIVEPAYNLPVRERFEAKNRETGKIILQAIDESWVQIEDARGKTIFSRVLLPGDVFYMPAGDKYRGTFGNAGGIDVWVNGKLAPKVGDAHTRKTGFSMSADSLMRGESVKSDKSEKSDKSDKSEKAESNTDQTSNQ